MYMTDCQSMTADYEKLKEALLKNFDMTERGFRKKFRYERPEKSETFIQFSSRLRSYLKGRFLFCQFYTNFAELFS